MCVCVCVCVCARAHAFVHFYEVLSHVEIYVTTPTITIENMFLKPGCEAHSIVNYLSVVPLTRALSISLRAGGSDLTCPEAL